MTQSAAEPGPYLAEQIREKLLRDPDVGELDIHVHVDGRSIVITGHVSTEDRRQAITKALTGFLPDHEVRNDTTVSVYPEAPEGSTP